MLVFFGLSLLMLLACGYALVCVRQTSVESPDDSPEWAVLRAKRDEIESDPTLSDDARNTLRAEWTQQADAVLARASQNTLATKQISFDKPVRVRLAAIVLTLGVAVFALVGHWDAEALAWHSESAPVAAATQEPPPRDNAKHPGDNLSLDERVAALKAKLEKNPEDINGWVLLARSYGIQRQFDLGAAALEKALALAPGHPDLLADLADMLAMTQNKTLEGRPLALINAALKAEPAHQKALALAATAAMMRGDKPAAVDYWKKLRATFPADAPDLAQIDATLASLGAAPEATATPASAPAGPRITGQVALSSATAAKLKQSGLPDTAVLFVVAKVPGGMPMPVAVARLSPKALLAGEAINFTLDDSVAMSPQMKLSAQQAVDVEARISMAGTAARGPQDVFAKLAAVRVGASGLRLNLE